MAGDNGKEYSEHKAMAKSLNTDLYYAHPILLGNEGVVRI